MTSSGQKSSVERSKYGCLQPLEQTATLTAWATDDLNAEQWVTLYEEKTNQSPSAFWYVMQLITAEQHWNRSIFSMDLISAESVSLDTNLATNISPSAVAIPPPPGMRVHMLRRLSRKTPAPIGGLEKTGGRAYNADEWAALWSIGNSHNACFGLCIPTSLVTSDNPRALRYWPFQYPKVRCYRFVYEYLTGIEKKGNVPETAMSQPDHESAAVLRYEVVPLGDEAKSPRHFETLIRHARPSAIKMITHVRKRMVHYDPNLGGSTYVKRVAHDNLLTEDMFRTRYDTMKLKYGYWVNQWTECTDPVKFVFEELSIAAYLCALWEVERERESLEQKQSFIDCGCGNGFLVYLLISEGHPGVGIDLQKRSIWDLYPSNVKRCLLKEEIDPLTYDCSSYDWIVGNHSDELSPWIPVMTARAQKSICQRQLCRSNPSTIEGLAPSACLRRAYPRCFILPCCFYDFDGKKLAFGRTRRTVPATAPHGTGKYEQYYRWIAKIMRVFGFTVEYENLRIPSTKYVSLIGRFVEHEERISEKVIREMTSLLLLDAQLSRA